MKIKGFYKFQHGDKIFEGENLITLLGESFFLNRSVNNSFEPIEYILFGNSSIQAKKSDIRLGNETVRKKCSSEVNLDKKQIILTCTCSASEIIDTSEIGVANDSVLISHDTYDLEDDFIDFNVDYVDVTYTLQLSTSTVKSIWQHYTSIDTETEEYNVYYVAEEENIVGVTEENTKSGYRRVASLNELKNHIGAYYYDSEDGILYIRTTRNDNPNVNYEITVDIR